MKKRKIIENKKARIPFSVIGVFLILGSSFATVYVTNLEKEKSEEISKTINFNEIETFLRIAEADMATALNLAGLKGLKEIGEKPVIKPQKTDEHDYGTTANEINKNRVKSRIIEDMNLYLNTTYQNNLFNNGHYAINVKISKGNKYPIQSRDDISIKKIKMKLDRSFTNDWIGPPPDPKHKTYWVANIPIKVEIIELKPNNENKLILNRTIEVSTIITCRYNLLKELVDEYQDEISGGPFDGGENSLFTVLTVLFNIYTLARGYQHWMKGTPSNVVQNDHLEPMVNTAILLEQGFVFGSVDPMALVEQIVSTGGSSADAEDNVFNGFQNGIKDWTVDTEDVTNVIPKNDGGTTPTMDITPEIDVESIATNPLYELDSITLEFNHKDTDDKKKITINDPTNKKIKKTVEEQEKKGYLLLSSEKNYGSKKNQTSVKKIKSIITEVYSTEIKTEIERGKNLIKDYESSGYVIDKISSPWVSTSYKFLGSLNKPSKGNIDPGDILYGEFYEVDDNQILIKMILNEYSNFDGLKNDVKDIFYENSILNDLNLEDSIDKYKDKILTKDNISNWLDDTSIKGLVDTSTIEGDYNSWVENDAWNALIDIHKEIIKIKLDPSITMSKYPDPIDLMRAAKKDLLEKYEENMSKYLSKSTYLDGTLFQSTGKKSVYCIRKWYVDKVHYDIEHYYTNIEDTVNDYIDDALEDGDAGASADDVHDALSGESMSSLQNQFTIPMGYDITLKSDWTEKIKIAVDQNPNYLKLDNETEVSESDNKIGDESFYPLKIRNTCTLGPLGFPVSPTFTPWIFTFNIWLIEVKGEYREFKVVDTTDETHFNPYIGHDAQIYIRRHEAIKDGPQTIGENTRLTFGTTTISMSFVPPAQCWVGDTTGGLVEESDGW